MTEFELNNGTIIERHVPWWNIGKNVEAATTSQEAMQLANLNWTVSQEDVYVNNVLVPNYKANVKSNDRRVLGMVSPKYQVVQNVEAFDFTNSLVDEGVTFVNAGEAKLGRLVWLLAKLPSQAILDDTFDPYVCFTNTHDGSGSIKVSMTPIRVICSNMLNLALKEASRTWTTRHIGDIMGKLSEAKRTLELANDYMVELGTEAEHLANNNITDIEVINIIHQLFPITKDMSDRQKENTMTRRKEFLRCYSASDISKFKNSEWGLINAASDFATHTPSFRNTATAEERNWINSINGSNIIDTTMKLLPSRAA